MTLKWAIELLTHLKQPHQFHILLEPNKNVLMYFLFSIVAVPLHFKCLL